MTEPGQLLSYACGYPWGPAPGSCVFAGGELVEMTGWDGPGGPGLRGRQPVLAYGSNASLDALKRKFGARETIPIVSGAVADRDVVYSAHISPYGAIPATLYGSPGTSLPVCVMWLSGDQLDLLHASEPNYRFVRSRLAVELEPGGQLVGPGAYVSRHGALRLNGQAVALEALAARGRKLPALGQRDVLEAVRRRLGFAGSLESFVAENVAHPQRAAERTAQLRADAVAVGA
jgi:hypothetical protein